MTNYTYPEAHDRVNLTGEESPLERAEKFRKFHEKRAKKLFKAACQALIAIDAGDPETGADILARALDK